MSIRPADETMQTEEGTNVYFQHPRLCRQYPSIAPVFFERPCTPLYTSHTGIEFSSLIFTGQGMPGKWHWHTWLLSIHTHHSFIMPPEQPCLKSSSSHLVCLSVHTAAITPLLHLAPLLVVCPCRCSTQHHASCFANSTTELQGPTPEEWNTGIE